MFDGVGPITSRVFIRKAGLKLGSYADRLSVSAAYLPKRLLAESVASLIGPVVAGVHNAYTLKRDKPHILILRNRYYSKNSTQISTEVNLDNTLAASGLATFEVMTYDHDMHISPLSDLQLIAKCRDIRPEAIVLSSWGSSPRHPSIDSFKIIRERMGIPIAAIWWDTCTKGFWEVTQPFLEHFDVHVIADNPNLRYVDQGNPFFQRIIQLVDPREENLILPSIKRDIPVSFLGQVSSYRSYRRETIDYLIDQQIPGRFLMSNRDEQVSHSKYVELLTRSKISLNFSYSVDCHQLKGRVFDVTLAGAMLLESENDQISQLYTPMKDYVPFGSKEDLVDKIHYYLGNEDERIAIAEQGRLTTISNCNGNKFWQLLLGKLKLIKLS